MVMKAAGVASESIAKVEIVEALLDAVEKAAGIEPDLLAQVGAEVLDDTARRTLGHLLPTTKAKEATDMPEFDKASLSPEALAYVESLEDKVAKAAPAAPETEDEALAKALEGLPEPLRKAFQKQASDLAEATAVAKAERDQRLDAEYLAKAKGFKNLTVEAKDLGPLLRKVAEFDVDTFVEVDRLLKAADAQVGAANLFKAAGAPASVITDGSALSSLDAIAKQMVADGTALDYPTAVAKAAEAHPDLYEAHRRESLNQTQEG